MHVGGNLCCRLHRRKSCQLRRLVAWQDDHCPIQFFACLIRIQVHIVDALRLRPRVCSTWVIHGLSGWQPSDAVSTVELILRNEDLDPQRCRTEFVQAMIEDLRWLGITWAEGPDRGGLFGPYIQSERRSFYLDAWRELLDRGFIYPCTCSRKDVAQAVGAPNDSDDEPIYSGSAGLIPRYVPTAASSVPRGQAAPPT